MPEIGAKGSIDKGVVKVSHTWAGDFKDNKTATMDMVAIYKTEKGGKAPSSKGTSSGGVKVAGGAKKKSVKKAGISKAGATTAALFKGTKTPAGDKKKSVARIGSAKGMASPGVSASRAGTPGMTKQTMAQLKSYLMKSKKK